MIIDPAGNKETVVIDSHAKVGGVWVPVTPETIEKSAAAIQLPASEATAPEAPDTATQIKYLLDGLRARPITQGDLAYMKMVWEKEQCEARAWNIAFALTNGHRVPKQPKPKKPRKMSAKSKGPSWYDENGKLLPGVPQGAYMRMRTEDAMVWLTEHRPAKNGGGESDIDWLRENGWSVAVHNDYRTEKGDFTFWLFTHGQSGRYAKGEGRTDEDALRQCRVAATQWMSMDGTLDTLTSLNEMRSNG